MIQFNLSLFIDNKIEQQAITALTKIILPELKKWKDIKATHLFSIDSHQEKDSIGLSIQCLIPNSKEKEIQDKIVQLINGFFQAEFPNQFVYFSSQLSLKYSNQLD
ncbi:hypothetical protein EOJ36_02185 [Sandaracinomonas limnophila]|uniref:Uncharacterized protein n=1 Tax=Sandaracinomonas limnophila TaxID=1862386 RepID=A0A437PX24_9BACT|nr:hypothetical protein [Sandaracinomonas limnophila]RVU26826.1 hypothetical protein EOJ36_02185 [Sandaracinomonas limnophila]